MSASHAEAVETFANPTAATSLHNAPSELASSTLLPRPRMKSPMPSCTAPRVILRLCSSRLISEYLTIGPAISCGKRTTKVPKLMMLRSVSTLPA